MADRLSVVLSELTAAQRKLLQMSVHLNPVIVANVDGNFSVRESAAVAKALRTMLTDPQYRPLLPIAGSDEISDVALRVFLEQHSRDVEGYLREVARLVERLPPEVSQAYRQFTLYAVLSVAEASRDGLFGLLGERINAAEKKVMRTMVELLQLEPTAEHRAKLGI